MLHPRLFSPQNHLAVLDRTKMLNKSGGFVLNKGCGQVGLKASETTLKSKASQQYFKPPVHLHTLNRLWSFFFFELGLNMSPPSQSFSMFSLSFPQISVLSEINHSFTSSFKQEFSCDPALITLYQPTWYFLLFFFLYLLSAAKLVRFIFKFQH